MRMIKIYHDDQLKKRYQKIAVRRVKLAILMQQIANEQKIDISEKELSRRHVKICVTISRTRKTNF